MALNTNINVTATSTDVAAGLEPGKRALKGLDDTAKSTGKSLAGMGDGSAQSAQKVEQATKSLVSSIQRTTAVMDSGARGSVEYYKALANQRGVDSNVLKPYLDQLDAVKVKQAQAAAAMLNGSQSLDKIGMSAAATANALRGVPAQFTDIVTSIQGGQAPLTVFLQQGGQLKDMFGGAGNAAKALGGYVLGLINPYTLAAGAAAGLAIAYESGAAESRAFNSALILSGNQAGVTTGQLMAMASSIDQISGTQGAAAEALALFAASGKIGAENLEQFTLTAIRFEKVTGTAIGDTVKKFEELRKAPLEATLKLNETMGYLTQTVYDQIKALTEQGRVTDAAALAQEEFNKATASMAGDMEKNLGTVQRSWMSVKSAVVETWDAIKGIGRDAGLEGQVAAAQKMVDIRRQAASSIYGNASDLVKLSEAENQLKGYQELLKNQQLSAQYAAERAASVKSQVEFDKESEKYLSKSVKLQQAIAAAQERFSSVSKTPENTAKYVQEIAGLQKQFEETAKKSTTARAAVNQAAKDDIAAARLMADLKTKFDGDEIKRLEKTREELEKTMEAYAKASEAGVSNAIEAATAAETELANYGLLKSAVQELTLNNLEQARESSAMAGEDVANIEKRIAAQKRLIAATKGVEVRTVSDNAAKEAAAEWKRTSDSIQNTLTDALMRGFESGKDFARNLRDTVVNMFKTLVLRPIISAVINPVAGALTGALGLSGAAQAAGTGSSVLSSVGTIAGLASTFGAGLKAGFAGLMGEAGLMGTISAGTTALGAGNIAGGLGTLGGPLALATAAILGLSAIIKATSGETRNGAKYGVGSDGKAIKLEGPSGGEIAATQAQAMFNVAKSSIEGMLTGFGSKAVLTGFTAGLESSENGKGFAYATGAINGKSFGDVNTYMNSRGDKTQEQALKDYQLELTQSILEGLQVTEDIPASVAKLISDGLNGSEVKALSLEATSAILANVENLSKQVNTFNAAMTQLPFEALKNLSFDAAAGLIAAAGGFEKLDANLGGYYANFYRADEQRAQSILNLESAFAALGETMPVLDASARDVYRSMVEQAAGQDLSVEANQKAYAALLSLQGPMNELAPAFDSVAQSAADAAATMTSAWANVMQARGVAGNDVTKFTAQAAIDAAFTEYKKTDKFGIVSASQFQTITQADFANYSSDNQKLIATILTGFSDLSKANAPAVVEAVQAAQATQAETYSAPAVDTSIADAIAQITKGLTDAGVSLGVELLKAQGKTVDAMAAQRAIDTAGYNAAQIALYDYNQTLRDSITAANEATAAQQVFNSKRQSLQQQYDDQIMTQAQKRNAEWMALNAQDPTGQLSGLQIAIWDFGDAAAKTAKDVTDAAAATATAITRNNWRDKLDVLMGSRTQEQMDTQNALAGVTDLATVELILLVRGLEKTAAAAAAAAESAKALAATNKGYQDQLDLLTGAQTDRSIALRDTTDESTRALMRQVYAQQDLKSAADKAAEAAATLKAAFESLESARVSVASAYKSISDKAEATNTAVDAAKEDITQGYLSALDAQTAAQQNVADITRQAAVEMRGFADDIQDFILQMSTSDLGSSSKAQQLAASQADFAVSAAQARAGDKNALAGITGKASNLLGAGREQFANATDYARFTAKIGNTLQDLATLADGKAGPLAEAIDPMVKAQADLLKANQDVEKWTEAASVSSASTAKTVADYLKDWTKATAENALAQADLKAAQLLTKEIDLETLDVLGELKVLIESYNSAKSSVTDAGGVLPSLTVSSVAIIPSAFNPIASGSGDTARLEALIDGLTQEVIGLRAEAQATAGHTSRTARLLDRAMPDGDALATRTAA